MKRDGLNRDAMIQRRWIIDLSKGGAAEAEQHDTPAKHVESPFIEFGQTSTIVYFAYSSTNN